MKHQHGSKHHHENPQDHTSNSPTNPFHVKLISPEDKGTPTSETGHDSSKSEKNPPKWWGPDWWTAGSTCVLAAFAIASFVVLYRQLDDAHRNFVIDQRAWVGSKGYDIHFQKVEGKGEDSGVSYAAIITNTGRTPALDVTVDSTLDTTHNPANIEEFMQNHRSTDTKGMTHSIIMPGDFVVLGNPHEPPVPLNPIAIEAIEHGTKFLYLFGTIRYHDIFAHEHITHFCALYAKNGAEECPKGNWTDNNLE